MTTEGQQLVLQIFPRHAPERAVTYAGDQDYIRKVLQDLGTRLEEAGPGGRDLHLLDDDDGEGDR